MIADRVLLADALACNDTAFVAELLEAAEARLAETQKALDEGLRIFNLWEMSYSDEMGLDTQATLVAVSEVLRASLTTYHTDDAS